jgi:Lon protease-like protein
LERATRLGYDVAELDPQLSMDPSMRLWQLAAAAPLGPNDRQRILEAPSAASRADLVAMLALDAAELFGLQLRRPDSE